MSRIRMIDPEGRRVLATEAAIDVLIEKGYELADEVVAPEPEPEPEPEVEETPEEAEDEPEPEPEED